MQLFFFTFLAITFYFAIFVIKKKESKKVERGSLSPFRISELVVQRRNLIG
jgi:hypothetical protein